MTVPSDERLMRYFDGESDEAEAREIEAWLERSERARLVISSFGRVGDVVRSVGDDVGASGVDIADRVMARLGRTDVALQEVPPARGGPAARSAARRWTARVPAIGLAMAAAAVLALYFRPKAAQRQVPSEPSALAVLSARESEVSPTASEQAVVVAGTESGAAIESVDFGAVAGTIFMVPNGASSDESDTPVVWLMDEPAPNEGRMAPL